MLTVIKLPNMQNPEVRIELPDSTLISDVERFCRLAAVFYGHHEASGSWVFTEMRGRKCLALWEAGFDARAQYAKQDRHCITHPNDRRMFSVADAVRVARVVKRKVEPVVVAEEVI